MTKIALTAAAILVVTGSTFAGSDHFSVNNVNQPAAAVDDTYTASVTRPDMARHDLKVTIKSAADEPGQGIWGR